MRKVLVVLILTVAGLIPLVRYHPGEVASVSAPPAGSPPPQPSETSGGQAPPSTGSGAPPSTGSGTPPSTSGGSGGTKTVDGPTVDTDFGPYQVRATFTSGRLTDVEIITEPSDGHSQRIADYAAPTLREEALQAQSARIDTVSGATATSEAYAQSLQAAIDAK